MDEFLVSKKSKRPTAECPLYDEEGVTPDGQKAAPVLIVRQAGEPNKPYFNEVLRKADHFARRKTKVDANFVRDQREGDYGLFPKYVIVGWRNVVYTDGRAVPFSLDNCEKYLRACGDDTFDQVRDFCKDAHNFQETADGASAAGNSLTV